MWYEFLAFRRPAWLCFVLYYVSCLLFSGGGYTGQWWGGSVSLGFF